MAQFIFQPNAKFRANKNGLFWNQQHGGNGINKHILCTHFLPQSEISSWRTCRWARCTLKNSNSLHLPVHCYQYYPCVVLNIWTWIAFVLLIHIWLRKELKYTFFTVYKWGGGSPDHLPPPPPPIVVSGRQKNGSEQTPIHTHRPQNVVFSSELPAPGELNPFTSLTWAKGVGYIELLPTPANQVYKRNAWMNEESAFHSMFPGGGGEEGA